MAAEGDEGSGLELIGPFKIEPAFLARCRVERFGPTHGTNQLYGLLDMIEKFLTKESYVCEVGSYDGVSTSLFARCCKLVTAIDAGRFHPCRPKLQKVMDQYPNIRHVRYKSPDASNLFRKHEFDAIYLDAGHDFDSVRRDIAAWVSRVRKGGILCGHDYISDEIAALPGFNWNSKALGHGGVRKAVDLAFAGQEIHLFSDSSWAVVIK